MTNKKLQELQDINCRISRYLSQGKGSMTDADYDWSWEYHILRNIAQDAKRRADFLVAELDEIVTGEKEPNVYAVKQLAKSLKENACYAFIRAVEIVNRKEQSE